MRLYPVYANAISNSKETSQDKNAFGRLQTCTWRLVRLSVPASICAYFETTSSVPMSRTALLWLFHSFIFS